MKSALIRGGAMAAVFASALVLAGCETPEEPAPPPPPPPPPAMALSSNVVHAAASYRAYVRDAASIGAAWTDPESIQVALRRGAAFEPKSFSRGAVAYAAVLALQDPAFVQGVRTYAADPASRNQVIRQLMADPAYAAQLPGAQSAAGVIIANLSADGAAIHRAGTAVKQSAYDVQRQKWSREHVSDREGRLATAKRLSTMPVMGSSEDSAMLMQAAMSGSGLGVSSASASPPYTEAVVRGMAIAALAVLGAAGEDNAASIDSLLNENVGTYCLNLSKLNLYQCLAVSKPHYEDVFCLGQHVLMDAGQCVTKVSGYRAPAAMTPPPLSQASAPTAAGASQPAVQTGPSQK
ncbi:MAG TPA: hypothetical protein VEA15_05780 [Caulobacteraceae bacterium]|nr:hypothetical protein [Caulobacteraceae bacterium]